MKKNPQKQFADATALHRAGKFVEAEKKYRAVLNEYPFAAEVHNSHGAVLASLGRLQDAANAFERAASIEPSNPRYQFNLANTQLDRGAYEEAVKNYQRIVLKQPRHYGALYHQALALTRLERYSEAAKILHPVCLENGSVDAFELYGTVLVKLKRYDHAREVFDRALMLNPNSVNSKIGLADILMGLNQSTAAIEFIQEAVEQHPDEPMLLLKLGRAFHEKGDSEKARRLYESVIEKFPDFIEGYISIAEIKKFGKDDVEIVRVLEDALAREPSYVELHFKLGKIYDDLGDFERAFSHYESGNRLKNKIYLSYKIEDLSSQIDEIIEIFKDNYLHDHASLGVADDTPVFVVGMPRSGTTLTEQILARHPNIAGAGEVDFWEVTQKNTNGLMDSQDPYPHSILTLSRKRTEEIAEIYIKKLKMLSGASSVKRIVDKMPHNFMRLGLISVIFPKARIIHVQRAPIDNCLSIFFQNFNGEHPYAYDLEKLGSYYHEYQRLMAFWREVLRGRMLEIQYEDLVSDPEALSRQMIEFVGLDWDDACLAPHSSGGVVRSASIWQARQPVYKTSVGRWKNYEGHLAPLIGALGYEN